MVVGAGHVATFQVAATLMLFPRLKKVYVYDGLSMENAEKFAASMPDTLKSSFDYDACGVSLNRLQTCQRPRERVISSSR